MTNNRDVTDQTIDPDEWGDHQILCFKKEWLRRNLENICLCPRCQRDRREKEKEGC